MKVNLSNNIITLKGKKFIPHLAHQLPSNYQEISLQSQFNLKGYTYIDSSELNWSKDRESRLTQNRAIGGASTR